MMGAQNAHSESGFTLVETLIALLILAISSGLLVQSISLASSQIKSSRNLMAAEQVAISILADHSARPLGDVVDEGIDPASNLFWRYIKRTIGRKDGSADLKSIELIEVEIRLSNKSPKLYRLATLATP